MSVYKDFVLSKAIRTTTHGFACGQINEQLFPFQRDIVRWACELGRAEIFADTGLGKTAMQCEWARLVCLHTGGNVLILAPLCVAHQTVREGEKFGVKINYCREQSAVLPGVNITN